MPKNNGKSYIVNVLVALAVVAITVVYLVISAINNDNPEVLKNEEIIRLNPDSTLVPSGPPNITEPTFAPPISE